MRNTIALFFLFSTGILFAQDNTEIYVFDMAFAYEGLELLNAKNISNNAGYDNQPSFTSNETVIFSGNNNGQTDIAEYNLKTGTKKWINKKTDGSEFSPQKFPSNNAIAAVRLDKDGKQRLYSYNLETGKPKKMLENIQVAYFAFYSDEKLLATVLSATEMDLVWMDLKTKSVDTLLQNAGRGLQKIPKSSSMAYTLINEVGNLDLSILDIASMESFFICELPKGVQDYIWLNEFQVLAGLGSKLFIYDTLGEPEWNKVASLDEFDVTNITRMAVSPDGKKLAVVVEEL